MVERHPMAFDACASAPSCVGGTPTVLHQHSSQLYDLDLHVEAGKAPNAMMNCTNDCPYTEALPASSRHSFSRGSGQIGESPQ
eukprot:370745-Amphidinium_carterae.1